MELLFYITCFFPFVKWLGIGGSSDVQPYCLIVTILFLIYYTVAGKKIVINRGIFNFYKVVVLGIFVGLAATLITGGSLTRSVRYLATYMSVILISLFAYLICKKNKGFDEQQIKIVINVYLVVGIIQRFWGDFLYVFIANARTTENRGVVGLASEPSFYGYTCIFLMILALDFKKNKVFYLVNLLFQICLLAKSSVTILYLGIFCGLLFLCSMKKISIKQILLIVLVVVLAIVGGKYYISTNSGQRIAFFINTFISQGNIKNAIKQLLGDYSVAVRVNDIRVCLEGFIHNFGIPNGFDTRKISSGYGSLILSMGWIGVAIIGYIFGFAKKAYVGKMGMVMAMFLSIIMFSAIQLANPPFAFLIGYFVYLGETGPREFVRRNRNNNEELVDVGE